MAEQNKTKAEQMDNFLVEQDLFVGEQNINQDKQPVPMLRTTRNLVHHIESGYRASKQAIQLSLFDTLPEGTQTTIIKKGTDTSRIYIGADLDGSGWRMIEAIQKLLYIHSNTTDQKSPNYYMGNYKPKTEDDDRMLPVLMGDAIGAEDAFRPIIDTSITEIATTYTCTAKPSGRDMKSVRKILLKYSQQNYVMSYREYYAEPCKDKKGNILTDKKGNIKTKKSSREIKGYMPLYSAFEDTIYNDKDVVTGQRIVIILNPIFQRQIATNYDTKPLNFLDRVTSESKKIWRTAMPDALLPFLNKLIDAQHNSKATAKDGKLVIPERTYHVKQEELLEMIAPKEMKKREIKKANERLSNFIKVAKEIGLLINHWTNISSADGSIIQNFQVAAPKQWK